jgi:hypothetical protein
LRPVIFGEEWGRAPTSALDLLTLREASPIFDRGKRRPRLASYVTIHSGWSALIKATPWRDVESRHPILPINLTVGALSSRFLLRSNSWMATS